MSAEVVWHELECGGYDADLPLWRELAERAGGPVADLGAGTGRVALDLAGQGHEVWAVEADPELAAAMRSAALASGASIELIEGDALSGLPASRFALVIAPMQFAQLFDGEDRRRLFRAVRGALGPGGLAAFAICETADAVSAPGDPPPAPERRVTAVATFESHPVAVRRISGGIEIERLRVRLGEDGANIERPRMDRLYDLSPGGLEEEAAAAGLRAVRRTEVPETWEHVGSTVVILEGA